MSQTQIRPAAGRRPRGLTPNIVLVLGILIAPIALTVMFNSYATPDAEAYVRMAFAQVAGATIAIGTVWALFVHTLLQRRSHRSPAWLGVLALVVTAWQIAHLSNTADLLVTRLGLAG